MIIRPYLTFNGDCAEAIDLYEKAFNTKAEAIARFSDMPKNPNFQLPEEFMDKILQATINFGDSYFRLSDTAPMNEVDSSDVTKIAGTAIHFEGTVDEVKNAFEHLSIEGTIKMPLAETFFSPCHAIVYDKFGKQWNLVAVK